MNQKLTLSLEKNVIEKAKIFANNQNKSLSRMVENYFRFITSPHSREDEKEFAPIVEELLGSIKAPKNFNYDKAKYNYLAEKYLND